MSIRVATPRRTRWLGSQDFDIHDRPYTPHPYDDEFDSPTLDPKWQLSGSYPYGNTTAIDIDPYNASFVAGEPVRYTIDSGQPLSRPSWLRGQQQPNFFWMFKQNIQLSVLGPNFLVYGRMSFPILNSAGQTADDSIVGFGLFGPSGANDFANGVFAQLNECDLNEVSAECGMFINNAFTLIGSETNNVGGGGVTEGQHGHTMALQVTGGTGVNAWMMSAAGNWLHIGSVTYTGGMHTVGVYGRGINGVNTAVCGHDYIRFKRGRFLP